ncbi:MAG TPA: hypothetical protein DIV86_02830 [Alphaproteobacteria bacterium]|nr:hypothetical protein [Alphaproteobacteria bacterium]
MARQFVGFNKFLKDTNLAATLSNNVAMTGAVLGTDPLTTIHAIANGPQEVEADRHLAMGGAALSGVSLNSLNLGNTAGIQQRTGNIELT